MTIYRNGVLTDDEDASIGVTDRGLTLGDGLFETMQARAGAPLRLSQHLARLREGADFLGIPVLLSDKELEAALTETLAANKLAKGVLRLTLTRGAAARGLLVASECSPTLIITATEIPPPPPAAHACIAQSTRRDEASPLSRYKTLCYLDNIIARREADDVEANEALLLNTKGNIAEATISNVFLVKEDAVITPPVEDGALPGVMRGAVLETIDCRIASIAAGDFGQATEAFLTNSLGIRALVSVDGAAIGNGNLGPVTKRLAGLLNED